MTDEFATPHETDVRGCARCEGDHDGVVFQPLERPIEVASIGRTAITLSHWAPCPTNGEPILLALFVDDDPGAFEVVE